MVEEIAVYLAETKNLVAEPRNEKRAAGATRIEDVSAEAKGKILEFAWWLKKQGYKESTITSKLNS
ncbi:MAG: hypothetical protein QXK26_04505 [Candidatus Bathyarchaeia archaeon]